jgi:hypothetical protein
VPWSGLDATRAEGLAQAIATHWESVDLPAEQEGDAIRGRKLDGDLSDVDTRRGDPITLRYTAPTQERLVPLVLASLGLGLGSRCPFTRPLRIGLSSV